MLKKLEKKIQEYVNEQMLEQITESTRRNIKNFAGNELIDLMNKGHIRSDYEIELTKYVLIIEGYKSNDEFFKLKIKIDGNN